VTLPNFLVIGVHKGASTSLRAYLGAHPDVFVAPAWEPSYFALQGQPRFLPDGSFARPDMERGGGVFTLEDYEALFSGVTTESAIGEKSPAYLINPEAPHRIKELIPDVRLIAVLRNPVDRAFSHYQHQVRLGHEDLSFAEAVEAEFSKQRMPKGQVRHYVRTGKYAKRVERYQSLFPPEQLRIYLLDDLVLDTRTAIKEMYAYIGVDPSFEPNLSVRHNARPTGELGSGGSKTKLRHLGRSLVRRPPARPPQPPQPTIEPTMEPQTRQELLDFYRDDIVRLQSLIDRDLSAWLE
jgi:hypothetical protein